MEVFENNILDLQGLPQLADEDFVLLPRRYFQLRMWTWGASSLASLFLIGAALMWFALQEEAQFSDVPMALWFLLTAWCTFIGLWGVSEFHGFECERCAHWA